MIEAIQTAGAGIGYARRDPQPRRERRQGAARLLRQDAGERIEIDDALEASDFDDALPSETAAGGGAVSVAAIALRLVAAAERAVAMQARLGSTMVLRLAGGHG